MTYQELLNLPLSAYTPGQGDPSTEGGVRTASGAPMYTLEDYLRLLGTPNALPYVTGALTGPGSKPTGEIVMRRIGDHLVPVRLTDRGPGAPDQTSFGLDIASSNPAYATNFPYQGATGGAGAPPTSGDPANFGSNIAQGIGTGAPSDSNGLDNKAIGTAIIDSAKSSAAKSAQQTQEGMQKAASMIMNRKEDPRLGALTKDNPLAALLSTSATTGALQQLLASYFGQRL